MSALSRLYRATAFEADGLDGQVFRENLLKADICRED
jgi:hypothetical protein